MPKPPLCAHENITRTSGAEDNQGAVYQCLNPPCSVYWFDGDDTDGEPIYVITIGKSGKDSTVYRNGRLLTRLASFNVHAEMGESTKVQITEYAVVRTMKEKDD